MTDPTAQEGMAYTLRQATDADYAFLYHLYRVTLKHYVAQTWGWDEEVQATMVKDRFDPAWYQIVVLEGRDVGALVIEQRTDALVLANIQILPEYQGHGLGTAVIKAILEQAHREGVPVTLKVLKVNPARHLYERLGFLMIGETETHYLMSTSPT